MRADRLRQRREELGLTQAELGERLNLEAQAIYRYEKGRNDPSSDMLAKLANELSVSADWLLGLVNEQNSHLNEADLSADERRLIDAVRRGQFVEVMATAVELAKRDDQAAVTGAKPAPNG